MRNDDYPWRIFINLNVPFFLQKQLSEVQNIIPKVFKHSFRWVDLSLFHCTLVFLGNCEENQILIIKKIVEELEIKQEIQVSMGEFEFFPSMSHPKVFVVKLNDDNNLISSLYKEVYIKLINYEFQLKKNYIPHITIARKKVKLTRKEMESFISNLKQIEYSRGIPFKISRISVIRSILKPEGPKYQVLTQNSITKL